MTLLTQFIKVEWTHKGVMSIPLSDEGFKLAVDLIPRPTLLLYDKVTYDIYCQ